VQVGYALNPLEEPFFLPFFAIFLLAGSFSLMHPTLEDHAAEPATTGLSGLFSRSPQLANSRDLQLTFLGFFPSSHIPASDPNCTSGLGFMVSFLGYRFRPLSSQ